MMQHNKTDFWWISKLLMICIKSNSNRHFFNKLQNAILNKYRPHLINMYNEHQQCH